MLALILASTLSHAPLPALTALPARDIPIVAEDPTQSTQDTNSSEENHEHGGRFGN